MKTSLFKAKVSIKGKRYSRSLRISTYDINIVLEDYGKNYNEYVEPAIIYYSEDNSALSYKLSVINVIGMGEYLRGILGGERKKGTKRYAGLVVLDENIESDGRIVCIKLWNIDSIIKIPSSKYYSHLYNLLYADSVHPFYISYTYKILLSDRGARDLRNFIEEIISSNEDSLSKTDREKLKTLIKEIQQPNKLSTLVKGRYYVVFRSKSTFSASTFIPDHDRYLIYSNLGLIDCGFEKDKAYYYTAVLNYLAYKVILLKRSFVRDQYLRPLIAIVESGLTWNNILSRDSELVHEIISLSMELHDYTSREYRSKDYKLEKQIFRDLMVQPTFTKLVKRLDNYVKENSMEARLINALSWVSED